MTVISMIPNDTPYLPTKVTEVPKDILRNFPHSKKVGNYLLGNTLGEGSFAKVKEALHIPTGERVAVKIIDKKKSREDSYVRKNLRREGKILQMVRHKNVVQLLEIMETQNSYYLVTELCRGGDLMDYISQRRRLPETEVKKYIRQVVSAVDYLHRLGILHRDLKIENLLLDEYKDMKIIDFGLSNCVKVTQGKDGPRFQEFCVTQCGSPAYAAPELLGRQKYGPQVDVWSIGVNMYAMLTGNLPFTVEPFNIKALHSKMLSGQMNPLPENISKECRDVLKKFLTADPDRRITLEEVLKHPWIADNPTTPMPRASCPNKLKTEALDGSILKHMTENQGFRVGEIIRYVTGNVPSSATAMYHLILRKLTKHIGNLKASGKIGADHRMLNRTQNNNNLIKTKHDSGVNRSNQASGRTDSRPNHTVNTIRHVVSKTRDPEHRTENDEGNSVADRKENSEGSSGTSHSTWKRTGKSQPKYEADETFTDLLQTKASADLKVPRSNSPTKPRPEYGTGNQVPNHLPNVAQKYVKKTKTMNTLESQQARTQTPTCSNESRRVERLSGTDAREDHDDSQFRKRASTFPGKTQRPKLLTNKLSREKQIDRVDSARPYELKTSKQEEASPTLEPSNVKINNLMHAPNSPKSRRNSLQQSENVSNSSQSQSNTPRSNQHMFYTRKFQQRRVININNFQISKERDTSRDVTRDVTHEDEPSGYLSKHVLSRPTRNNRIPRVTLGVHGKEEPIVVENLSEFSSGSSRPVSRNTNMSGNSTHRSNTPGLPALAPSITEGGKRNS